jgi:hypothetical protein
MMSIIIFILYSLPFILFIFFSNKYFIEKTILQIRNITKYALKLDHCYLLVCQQIKPFSIVTIFLIVMHGLTNNTRYSKDWICAMSSIFADHETDVLILQWYI